MKKLTSKQKADIIIHIVNDNDFLAEAFPEQARNYTTSYYGITEKQFDIIVCKCIRLFKQIENV